MQHTLHNIHDAHIYTDTVIFSIVMDKVSIELESLFASHSKAPLAYARDIDAEEEEPLAVIHVLGLNLGRDQLVFKPALFRVSSENLTCLVNSGRIRGVQCFRWPMH